MTSFEFNWSEGNKPSGKVFARKRTTAPGQGAKVNSPNKVAKNSPNKIVKKVGKKGAKNVPNKVVKTIKKVADNIKGAIKKTPLNKVKLLKAATNSVLVSQPKKTFTKTTPAKSINTVVDNVKNKAKGAPANKKSVLVPQPKKTFTKVTPAKTINKVADNVKNKAKGAPANKESVLATQPKKPFIKKVVPNNNQNKPKEIIDKAPENRFKGVHKESVVSSPEKTISKPPAQAKRVEFQKQASFAPEPASTFVKRKQRKEKAAAKLMNNEDIPQGQTNTTNSSNKSTSHSLFSERHKDVYVNSKMAGTSVVEKVFSAGKKFSDIQIHKYIVSNLEKNSFNTLTKVQEKSIPVIMSGKNVLIRSQTGSGKTLAYSVPILNALQRIDPRLTRADGTQAIIVVPTRELVMQTHELLSKINTFQWIVNSYMCGGENRKTEKDRLRKGVHILVGTPGRLLDHILHTTAWKIQNVRCLVLDEADRLLDMGFKKDIVKLVEELDNCKAYDPMAMLKGENVDQETKFNPEENPLSNPNSKIRQTLLLSATLNKGIAELAEFTMKEHVYIDALDESDKINPEHMVIPNTVKQEFLVTYVKRRLFTLAALLLEKSKQKVFVFMATTQMVDYHYELFSQHFAKMPKNRGKLKSGEVTLLDNMNLEDSDDEEEVVVDFEFFKLHGNMDQAERKRVFSAFRAIKKGVLFCTDVVARGVDVPEAECIIQYTGPQTDDDYIHRVGRTGRAGKSGSAIIFLNHEEQDYISKLQTHKVFLKELNPEDYLPHLCDLMEESDHEQAATALQRHFENAVDKDQELHRMACFAYSSWSRFYNAYPGQMREIFNFKNINLGHYVTSFALKETPSSVARIVRGNVNRDEPRRLNKKLSTHSDTPQERERIPQKRKIKSITLTTSEFGSGLAPAKKKKKKN